MPTTISCQDDTKDRFDDLRPVGVQSNDEFLTMLLDTFDDDAEHQTPVPLLDALGGNARDEALADAGSGLTFDDAKAACAAAIRDELPTEEMGR